MTKGVRVGIAVVECRGAILVGRRPAGPLAGHDEFPGGKCLSGESPQDGARRECREETGLDVTPIELLLERSYEYPDVCVDLSFWLCRTDLVRTRNLTALRWVPVSELRSLRFPDANAPVIEILERRFGVNSV